MWQSCGAFRGADTTDEVWLELLSPPKKAQRVVFVWGDQTYKQLALPPDHEYTDFALETKGARPCAVLAPALSSPHAPRDTNVMGLCTSQAS